MNSITENLISLEEANYALNCMKKHLFTPDEAIETLDEYVNRVRNINLSWLTDYIIETKLSSVQREIIRKIFFESKSAAECSRETGLSLRGVYSAKARGMETIGEYIEPVIMYFRNLQDKEITPLFVAEALKTSKAQKKRAGDPGEALKNLRTANCVDTDVLARALKTDEKRILSGERGKRSFTVEEIEKYSRLFGVKITVEFNQGKVSATWIKQ